MVHLPIGRAPAASASRAYSQAAKAEAIDSRTASGASPKYTLAATTGMATTANAMRLASSLTRASDGDLSEPAVALLEVEDGFVQVGA